MPGEPPLARTPLPAPAAGLTCFVCGGEEPGPRRGCRSPAFPGSFSLQAGVALGAAPFWVVPGPMAATRVLVVEDDTPVRTLVRDVLEADGFAVLEAADGAEGL